MVAPCSSACRCRLATWVLLFLVLALTAQARDMYVLMEHAPMPVLMYEGQMWCALADLDRRENYSAGGYRLFIHDFATHRDSLVQDPGLIDTVNCLAQNGSSVFVGGRAKMGTVPGRRDATAIGYSPHFGVISRAGDLRPSVVCRPSSLSGVPGGCAVLLRPR